MNERQERTFYSLKKKLISKEDLEDNVNRGGFFFSIPQKEEDEVDVSLEDVDAAIEVEEKLMWARGKLLATQIADGLGIVGSSTSRAKDKGEEKIASPKKIDSPSSFQFFKNFFSNLFPASKRTQDNEITAINNSMQKK